MVLLLAVLSTVPWQSRADDAELISVEEALAWPRPQPDHVIAYGQDPNQFGELRLPKAAGPHPLAIIVHGGGWEAQYDLGYISRFAQGVTDAGIATWSIEYRRADNTGGGWPGTFLDVGAAADFVRTLAERFELDLTRVISIGHSAGGQLALWLAARSKVSANLEIVSKDPLPLIAVMGLAPVNDLRAWYDHPLLRVCDEKRHCVSTVGKLMGGSPQEVPIRYREANPREMLPLGLPQSIVLGGRDIWSTDGYYEVAKRAGDEARLLMFETAGHFEIIDPQSAPWPDVIAEIRRLARHRMD